MTNRIYTLQGGNKTLSVIHRQRHYVIGFQTAPIARKVQYSIHPEPKFVVIRNNDISLSQELEEHGYHYDLNIDVTATLFIPKCKGSTLEPMNDGGFHLSYYTEEEFMLFPIVKNLGIIIPYKLELENDEEFIYKSYVVDPSQEPTQLID